MIQRGPQRLAQARRSIIATARFLRFIPSRRAPWLGR
jgi:hypothetical protein